MNESINPQGGKEKQHPAYTEQAENYDYQQKT